MSQPALFEALIQVLFQSKPKSLRMTLSKAKKRLTVLNLKVVGASTALLLRQFCSLFFSKSRDNHRLDT
jgi:hypothetical protein